MRIEYLARKKYIKNAEAIYQSFHESLYNVKKTFTDSTIYADFAIKFNFYYSFNYANEIKFWNQRNDHMVNQILNYSKQFEGKKIVVLTGLNHKYYLQDKIRGINKTNIQVVDLVSE